MDLPLVVLTIAAALGSATVGGVFYAFSTFVMPSLRQLPPAEGTRAMQQINVAAVGPGLMIAFFGTALLCVAVAAYAGITWSGRRSLILLIGSALYLLGTFGLTIGYNVPLNNALAAADSADPGVEGRWRDYARRWTSANHARTAAALVAATAFLLALLV